ncbi:type I secretion protein [Mesorhizobium sp. ES1-4]|uniref:type I secretion protein n=1 Tax=Mesorhizobium sp. ES1-4 TaxID=2876627 RepID=UPI001CCD45FE|nr:type I secretion protein [Mesorhizobium sp. ES1-4]MBZ9795353.1 type I secretion protein [Mesorhizobium sp. ES1-4]
MYAMQLDKITEAIAHFIGLFEISVEDARQLQAYDDFKIADAAKGDAFDLANTNVAVKAPYTLDDFNPHVSYMGIKPDLVLKTVGSSFWFTPPTIHQHGHLHPGNHHLYHPHLPDIGSGVSLPHVEPPGSVAVYINQENHLSDNDYVGAGGNGLTLTPMVDDGSQLALLATRAAELSPLDDLAMPGSDAQMAATVLASGQQIEAYPDSPNADANIFVLRPDAASGPIEGTYVNGQLVSEDAAPKLEDHLNYLKEQNGGGANKDDYSVSPDSPNFMAAQGNGALAPSVEVDTGGNTMLNSAVLTNDWTGAPVIAVVGNVYEVNAIVQINERCDSAAVSSNLNGWKLSNAPDESFNIATFKHIDPSADSTASTPVGDFPAAWVVTQVTGDLVITNWLQQYNFMTDNDTTVLSSSGVKTMVSTGGNTEVNDVSLSELSYNYDVIIIGGHIYDANIIHQLNIMVSNDLIGTVDGFQTSGEASCSTAGNLLWNGATIINVGGKQFDSLPDSYLKAAQDLAAGKDANPGDILHDPAFAGTGALRVLYVSGDLINIQYVSQTNMLGDSDQVVLAMNQVIAHPEAHWTITTGGNQVANFAGIVDVDGTGKTYVGGQHYSDEILIQANLVSSEPNLGEHNPDALANEAVAFLTDDTSNDTTQPDHHIVPTPDHVQADGMQTILG